MAERQAGGARNVGRDIVLIWLAWALLITGYQAFVRARFDLARPDNALDWTASWTNADSLKRHPYLSSPVLAGHTAYDSEFYISIALHGYDDPSIRAVGPKSTADVPQESLKGDQPTWISLNRAFFPGYPLAMGVLARPLMGFGLDPIGAAVVAGVIVSMLGTLGAMFAIADLTAGAGGAAEGGDGPRAAFYLLIWPAAVFLAQVYSEGLFLGLSFGALAMMRRDRWGWAAALAVGAVFTRATGFLLLIPFGWAFLFGGKPRSAGRALLALSPGFAYLVWRWLFGRDFDFTEIHYFGRFPFDLGKSWDAWSDAVQTLLSGEGQPKAYMLCEFIGVGAGLVTSAMLWRRDKALTLYGLAIFVIALTSGAALGMHRYVLSMPSMFLVPAAWGRSVTFDRIWTFANMLGLAALTLAFSFGFWAG